MQVLIPPIAEMRSVPASMPVRRLGWIIGDDHFCWDKAGREVCRHAQRVASACRNNDRAFVILCERIWAERVRGSLDRVCITFLY